MFAIRHEIPFHDRRRRPISGAVHHDRRPLGVDDDIVTYQGDRVELDLDTIADGAGWGSDVVNVVTLDQEIRYHTLAAMASEVQCRRTRMGDLVAAHHDASDRRGRHDRDSPDLREATGFDD